MSLPSDLEEKIRQLYLELESAPDATPANGFQEFLTQLALQRQGTTATTQTYDDKWYRQYADRYVDFTAKNPTIYHVVDHFAAQLRAKDFKYVDEKDQWDVKAGKYFTIRSGTSLAAFVVGKEWSPARGVGAIGSHIDALTTVLKPKSIKPQVDGYDLLGVANYAGALSDVWWDRDLGIGGRLIVREKGKVTTKLVDSTPHAIGHIPTLAPHFGTPARGPFNKETQAVPVIGFSGPEPEPTDEEKSAPLYGKHSLKLLRYVARLAKVSVADILQWDMQLYDVQRGAIGGLDDEFIFAPRVDDRVCSFAALNSLVEADHDKLLAGDQFSVVGLFDNEEIGSKTRQGAVGGLLQAVITRVVAANECGCPVEEALRVAYANSIFLSADVIHLVNPNFSGNYLEGHKPVPNKGLTLSLDPNGNMATDGPGVALLEQLARDNGDELQYFQIRNGTPSGGTIGPYISSATGARTIDLGIPQLSMHSIRAMLGSKDVGLGVKFFKGFWKDWRTTYDDFDTT
ncbi:vacuolar aminopeptidase 1 [Diutina catenulata]